MLWTDKYRPKTLDEVVGNNKEKALIQKWVDNWKAGNPQLDLQELEKQHLLKQ